MPELKEYQQRIGGASELPLSQVTRGAQGSDFSGAGQGMEVLGQSVQRAASDFTAAYRIDQDQKARREVTAAQVQLAQIQAQATKEMDDSVQNGTAGFEGWSDTFQQGWGTKLDELGSKFETTSGRRAFELGSAELRAKLLVGAGRANAQVAGAEAVQRYTEFVEAKRNQLIRNPGEFEQVLQDTVGVLNDPNGLFSRMPAEARVKLEQVTKREMAKSAVSGAIDMDPHRALASLQLGHYDDYLDADATRELMTNAKVAINGQDAEMERLRKEQERLRKEEIKHIQDGFITLLDKNELTAPMIVNSKLDPVGDGSKEHFLNVLRARAKEAAKPENFEKDVKVFSDALFAIRTGEIRSETQLEQIFLSSAESNRGIDWEMLKDLRKEFNDRRTPQGETLSNAMEDFTKKFQHQIDKSNPLLGQIDQTGKTQFGNWQRFVLDKVNQYKAAGKDPYLLFREGSPEYLASPEILSVFQRTLQDSIKESADRIRQGAPVSQNTLGREPGWVDSFLRKIGASSVVYESSIDLSKWAAPVGGDGKPANVKPLIAEVDGNWLVLPMADPSGKILTEKEAKQRALDTKEHFGVFKTPEAAERQSAAIAKVYASKAGIAQREIVTSDIEETSKRATLKDYIPLQKPPKIAPRNPGESISEYQKRIKGQK